MGRGQYILEDLTLLHSSYAVSRPLHPHNAGTRPGGVNATSSRSPSFLSLDLRNTAMPEAPVLPCRVCRVPDGLLRTPGLDFPSCSSQPCSLGTWVRKLGRSPCADCTFAHSRPRAWTSAARPRPFSELRAGHPLSSALMLHGSSYPGVRRRDTVDTRLPDPVTEGSFPASSGPALPLLLWTQSPCTLYGCHACRYRDLQSNWELWRPLPPVGDARKFPGEGVREGDPCTPRFTYITSFTQST